MLNAVTSDRTPCYSCRTLQELHARYYEPLAAVKPSADALLEDTVRKLLFMTDPALVDGEIKPFWEVRVACSKCL